MTEPTCIPILIAARNEARNLGGTLATVLRAVEQHQALDGERSAGVEIVVASNASTDDTAGVARRFFEQHAPRLAAARTRSTVLEVPTPGKMHALRAMIAHVETTHGAGAHFAVFTDAEVSWDVHVFHRLVTYRRRHPGFPLIGANIKPRNRRLTVWSLLESLPYHGYGDGWGTGQGIVMRFVSGMGYLADREAMRLLAEVIPTSIGNEDVALSALMGVDRIRIVSDAIVNYDLTETFEEFVRVRGRHIRELVRLRQWLRDQRLIELRAERPGADELQLRRQAAAWGVRTVANVSESRIIPGVSRYLFPKVPLNPTAEGVAEWLRSIPLVDMPITHALIVLGLAPLTYPTLHWMAERELRQAQDEDGWIPAR